MERAEGKAEDEFLKDITSIRTIVKPRGLGSAQYRGWILLAFSKPIPEGTHAPRTRILALRLRPSDPDGPKYDLGRTIVGAKYTPAHWAQYWLDPRSISLRTGDVNGPKETDKHGGYLTIGRDFKYFLEPILDDKEAEAEAREAASLEPEGGTQLFVMKERLAQQRAQLRKTRDLLQTVGPGGGDLPTVSRGRGSAPSSGAPRPASHRAEGACNVVNPHSRIAKRARTWEEEADLEGFED